MLAAFDLLVRDLVDACRAFYGDRLVSVAVFGSIGRGTPRPDSDVDVLVVADALPDGRVPRVEEFLSVERALAPSLDAARRAGLGPALSPVIRCPHRSSGGRVELAPKRARVFVLRRHRLRANRALYQRRRGARVGRADHAVSIAAQAIK